MKVNNIADRKNGLEGSEEDVVMGIDSDNHLNLLNSLTNLYSNPVMAAYREYCANAADAHKANGQIQAFEVNFPFFYEESSTLRIRDYGNGMTKEQLTKVYSQYGASTKGGDNTQVGGFGLGSKSGLAVSNHLYVNTVANGILIKAKILKNKDSRSVIRILSEEETTLPSGTEILLPITQKQKEELFKNAAQDLVGYSPKQVKLNGKNITHSVHNRKKFIPINVGANTVAYVQRNDMKSKNVYIDVNPSSFFDFAARTALLASGDEPEASTGKYSIIMGGVFYPDIPSLGSLSMNKNEFHKMLNGLNERFFNSPLIILNVPVGSVDLPPHRDAIIDTEKTWNAITGIYQNIRMGLDTSAEAYLNAVSLEEASGYVAAMNSLFAPTSSWKYKDQIYNIDLSASLNEDAFLFTNVSYYHGADTRLHFEGVVKESHYTPFFARVKDTNYDRNDTGRSQKVNTVHFKIPDDKYDELVAYRKNEALDRSRRAKLPRPRAHNFINRYLRVVVPVLNRNKEFFTIVTRDSAKIPANFNGFFDLTLNESEAKAEFKKLNPVKEKRVVQQNHGRATLKGFTYDLISNDEKIAFFGGKGCYGIETELLQAMTTNDYIPTSTPPVHLPALRRVSNGSDPSTNEGVWLSKALSRITPTDTSVVAVSDGRAVSTFQKTFSEAIPLGKIIMETYDDFDPQRQLAVQHAYSIISNWSNGIDSLFSIMNGHDHEIENESINLMFEEIELVGIAYYLFSFKDSYVEGLSDWKRAFIASMDGKELACMMLLPVQSLLRRTFSGGPSGLSYDGYVYNSSRLRGEHHLTVAELTRFVDRMTKV